MPSAVVHDRATDRYVVDVQALVPYTISALQQVAVDQGNVAARLTTVEAQLAELQAAAKSVRSAREQAKEAFFKKDYEGALQWFALALQKETSPTEASLVCSNRAACLYRLNKFRECLREAREAIKRDSHNFKAWVWKAAAVAKLHQTDKFKLAARGAACVAYSIASTKKEASRLVDLDCWKSTFSDITEVRLGLRFSAATDCASSTPTYWYARRRS